MKMKSVAFLVVLLLLNNVQASGDTLAPVEAPKGIPADTWKAFYEEAFQGTIFKDKTLRWGGNGPSVTLLGQINPQEVTEISNLGIQLKRLCNIYYPNVNVSGDSQGQFNIHLIPQSQFKEVIANAPTDVSSYGQYTYYSTGSLSKVSMVVDSNLTTNRNSILIFRLLQGLGFWGDTNDTNFPLFSMSKLTDNALTSKDKELYTLFCVSGLNSGDTFSTYSNFIENLISKIPNQPPQLKSAVEYIVDENSINLEISLTSLSEILTSGETKFNWKILDQSGNVFEESSIDNSENRIRNSWEVLVKGLTPNTNYRYIYNFSNAYGEGRTESLMFKTDKPSSPEIAEKVEQEILLFNEIRDSQFTLSKIEIEASATSGLELTSKSVTPKICSISGLTINFISIGKCRILLTQEGDSDFSPAESLEVNFSILGSKKTIICIKGKIVKKINSYDPKCPAGFKRKN